MAGGMAVILPTTGRPSLQRMPAVWLRHLTALSETFHRRMSSRNIALHPAAFRFCRICQRLTTLIGFAETRPKPKFVSLFLIVMVESFRFHSRTPDTALEPLRYTASRAGRRLPLPPSLRSYGGTSKFMDGLSYTTVIEFAEPLTRLFHRSRAKTDRRGSALDR